MRSPKPATGPSQRQLRVGEQIRHVIADTLQRGHFAHAALADAGKISVTEVRVSPDLKNATAYVVMLGGEDTAALLPVLNDHAAVFQKDIARQCTFKFTPRVRFATDGSFDNAKRIEELLRGIQYSSEE